MISTPVIICVIIIFTGVAIGGTGTGGTCPPEAYSVVKNSAKNAPKHLIFTPKIKNFLERGTIVPTIVELLRFTVQPQYRTIGIL